MFGKRVLEMSLQGAATAALTAATPLPVVAVTTSDTSIFETGSPAQFKITLDDTTSTALRIHFTLGGDAQVGQDYSTDYTGTVVVPADSNSAIVTITPIDDGPGEGSETVQ